MAFEIKTNEIASAIFGGFASAGFKAGYTAGWDGVVLSAKRLAERIGSAFDAAKDALTKGWKFFKQWWQDDPVGATAGALAAGLALGVVVYVGGTAIAAIGTSGLAGLTSINVLGLIKTGLGVAAGAGILGGLIRFAVRGVQWAWNFNFNITEKQIRQQQEGLINSLYGQAGAVVGSGLASLLCGSLPVAIAKRSNIVKVNPMMLAQIKELSEFNPHTDEYGEIYEEFLENVKALVGAGVRVGSQILFLESYKNVRKWIKAGAKYAGLSKIFPRLGKLIERWGEEGSQSWSFASAVENWVESIDDERLKNFTEEALENFMDVCTENTMVVSYLF